MGSDRNFFLKNQGTNIGGVAASFFLQVHPLTMFFLTSSNLCRDHKQALSS